MGESYCEACEEPSIEGWLLQPDEHECKRIRDEIGEDEDKCKHYERLIVEWIKCSPHLPQDYGNMKLISPSECKVNFSDFTWIRHCLYSSKYNLTKTKQRYENIFIARTEFPEMYANRNPKDSYIARAMDRA